MPLIPTPRKQVKIIYRCSECSGKCEHSSWTSMPELSDNEMDNLFAKQMREHCEIADYRRVLFPDNLSIDYINSLRDDIHQTAQEHGWHDEPRTFGDIIALCHSELSEALEEYRNGKTEPIYYNQDRPDKPEGIGVELADCIIRILDYCGSARIDIGSIILTKHEYNRTRPFRHGGKRL